MQEPSSQEPAPNERRAFLKAAAAITGALAGVFTVGPALRAFLSPLAAQQRPEPWVRLGEAAQFDLDVPTKVDFVQTINDAWVEQRGIHNVWVYTDDGETFTVFNGRCTHLGCGYGYDATQGRFVCPCHHGMFNKATGAVLGGPPPRPLDRLVTRVEHGILYAKYVDYRVGIPQQTPLG